MKLEVVSDKENKLYDRREVVAKVSATKATPSRKEILAELSKAVRAQPEAVVIDKVDQKFGANACEVCAKVYPTGEAAHKYEKTHKFDRTAGKKAEKKA